MKINWKDIGIRCLKQLSTFDSTKTQILKNINGTLTWVDEQEARCFYHPLRGMIFFGRTCFVL